MLQHERRARRGAARNLARGSIRGPIVLREVQPLHQQQVRRSQTAQTNEECAHDVLRVPLNLLVRGSRRPVAPAEGTAPRPPPPDQAQIADQGEAGEDGGDGGGLDGQFSLARHARSRRFRGKRRGWRWLWWWW